jgi:hypothetical protein
MDKDGCPMKDQPFPQSTKILHKLVPLWEHSIYEWGQLLGRGPNGRPYFLDDRELQWASPTLQSPIPQPLRKALTYLCGLLASTDPAQWTKLRQRIKAAPLWDLPIAPRWRLLLREPWANRPPTPSPLAMDRSTRQNSIQSALAMPPPPTAAGPPGQTAETHAPLPHAPTTAVGKEESGPKKESDRHQGTPPGQRRQR